MHPVSIAFAWEHHAFYKLNNFIFGNNAADLHDLSASHTCGSNNGDLYTQGLTVSFNFGF